MAIEPHKNIFTKLPKIMTETDNHKNNYFVIKRSATTNPMDRKLGIEYQ